MSGLPASLARKLLTEYSASGDLVLDVAPTIDHAGRGVVAAKAVALGRRCVQHHPTSHRSAPELALAGPPDELVHTVDLLVITLPGSATRGRPATRHDPIPDRTALAAWTRVAGVLLAPGGRLVVVTNTYHDRDQLIDLPAEVVRLVERGGLDYLQHIIALLNTIHGAQLDPEWTPVQPVRVRGTLIHAPVHADVLVFRTPTVPAEVMGW